jgi:hypothetical protein
VTRSHLGQREFGNYSNPVQLGKYWTILASPLDAAMFAANQACMAAGH